MITLFPSPYHDELFYSLFSRYHIMSGNVTPVLTMEELYNNKNACPNIYYPSNLNALMDKLPEKMRLSADYIIENHTIYPFLKPFMLSERSKKLVTAMKEGARLGIGNILRHDYRIEFSAHTIKICPRCYQEDKIKFGESYIHRVHQIPGNYICPIHIDRLYNHSLPSSLPQNAFFDINEMDINFNMIESKVLSKQEMEIAKEMKEIMDGKLNSFDIEMIKKRYLRKLKVEGYLMNSNINQSKLVMDFLKTYDKDLLIKLNADIDLNNTKNWIKRLTIFENRQINLIRHLLFIKFLFGGIQNFIDFDEEINPFGSGPWPCLNPVANHYKKDVITECTVKKSHNIGGYLIGTFKCSCGFIYTRNNRNSEDDKYKCSSIEEFGVIWKERLRKILLDNHLSVNEIANIMHCNPNTVIRYANILGLSYKVGRSFNSELGNQKNTNDNKLINYKNEIMEYINKNPEASRSKVKAALIKEYCYVQKYSREWIEKLIPETYKYTKIDNYKDWEGIDLEISKRIPIVVKEILEEKKLIRITPYSISKYMNYKGIRKKENLNKLPYTKEVIEKYTETIEEFKKRKIINIIETTITSGKQVTKMTLKSQINFSQGEYEKFEPFIRKYLAER